MFFSFDVVAQAAGSGAIGFTSLGTVARDTSDAVVPLDLSDLPGFSAVPASDRRGEHHGSTRRVLRVPAAEARQRAMKLLARVGLADRADAYPRELSGGQKQRVAIARALAMEPRGLLCDEITSALDPELKHEVLGVLEDLKQDGLALIVVTHELGFARRSADRIVVLDGGKVIEEGPPGQVFVQPQTERAQRFFRQVLA